MLPTEVVAKILQHVPQQPRFIDCTFVCRSWHTAAVTATSSLDVRAPRGIRLYSLNLWLQRHGANLKVLQIASDGHIGYRSRYEFLAIPCQQLQQLRSLYLSGLTVYDADDFVFSLWQGGPLSQLASLQLDNVYLWRSNARCDKPLIQFSKLGHLHLDFIHSCDNQWYMHCIEQGLAVWTQLTSLEVVNAGSVDSVFEGPRSLNLNQLQRLRIRDIGVDPGVVNQLQTSRTHLELHVWRTDYTPSITPRLSQLTCLRHLATSSSGFVDPQLLHDLVHLQHLDLSCPLGSKAAVATLLAVLPQLQQLQHLDLAKTLYWKEEWDIGADRYTALVSSTQLTCLVLSGCVMPPNAVYHMFTADHQYPGLHTLKVGPCPLLPDELPAMTWAVCEGALGRLVSRCPNLRDLLLKGVVDPDGDEEVAALGQLTALSKLELCNDGVSGASIAALVQQQPMALRHLRVISGRLGESLTAQGVLSLHTMTQLTRLVIQCGNPNIDNNEEWCVVFSDEGGLSDLWEQMCIGFKGKATVADVLNQERVKALEQQVQQQLLLAHQKNES